MLDYPTIPDPFLTKSALSSGFYAVAAVAAQVVAPSGPISPVKQDGADQSEVTTRETTRGNSP